MDTERRILPYEGVLFTFEGPDGSGKTTQFSRAARYFGEIYELVQGREPGGTAIGEKIRAVILNKDNQEMGVNTELLLYEASRAQLVHQLVRPALEQGKFVILDRFYDSSTAYQGGAGGLDLTMVFVANSIASQGIKPDRSYFFDVRPEIAAQRMDQPRDRLESKGIEYHTRVRESYLGIAKLEPNRIRVIDTSDIDADQVAAIVRTDIENYLKTHNLDRTLRRKKV